MVWRLLKKLMGSRSREIPDEQPQERISKPVASFDQSAYPYDHYSDAVEDIKQLKREERHQEVEDLLLWCIEFTETEAMESGTAVPTPAPAYYRHLGIVYRKDDRNDDEVALLERYMETCDIVGVTPNEDLVDRLDRARELADRD